MDSSAMGETHYEDNDIVDMQCYIASSGSQTVFGIVSDYHSSTPTYRKARRQGLSRSKLHSLAVAHNSYL